MKTLVCIKAVASSARLRPDGQLQREGSVLAWNVADEAALEAGLQLRGPEGTVTALTMGPASLREPLRELLARGADRAVLITDPRMAGADTFATAAALAAAARRLGPFDLILCGRRALDGATGQVPAMLAAALELPCLTDAERLSVEDGQLTVYRRLEEETAILQAQLPAVVSLCEYSCRLRLPGLAALRQARQKQPELLDAAALGLAPGDCGPDGSLTRVLRVRDGYPGRRRGARISGGPDGAAALLRLYREVAP